MMFAALMEYAAVLYIADLPDPTPVTQDPDEVEAPPNWTTSVRMDPELLGFPAACESREAKSASRGAARGRRGTRPLPSLLYRIQRRVLLQIRLSLS